MTKKYEEEQYRYENIEDQIYPWVRMDLENVRALGGKHLSEEDTPVLAFVGGLKIIFAMKREEETFEILKDNMLPPGCDIQKVYQKACENMVRDVEFVIANTWYGAFAILADGYHEASSLCFKHIWQVCVDKLKDDLVVMAPCKDTVLFAPSRQPAVVRKMIEHGQQAYDASHEKISTDLMFFSRDRKELLINETKY